MQVAYGSVSMAVYLAYYIPGFCKWMLSMPSDSFCLSKQVVLGRHQPLGSESPNFELELRRQQLQGKQSVTSAAADSVFCVHSSVQCSVHFVPSLSDTSLGTSHAQLPTGSVHLASATPTCISAKQFRPAQSFSVN